MPRMKTCFRMVPSAGEDTYPQGRCKIEAFVFLLFRRFTERDSINIRDQVKG